jgi:IS605 OrfB family transposase
MLKKYNEFEISGRADAKYGNFVFKATPIKDDIFNIDFELMDGQKMRFPNVRFPYRGKELAQVLNKDVQKKEMTPICFGMIKKMDALGRVYYQFKVTFNIGSIKRINTDKTTGCFGMDFNYGHLDVSEIDGKGNMIYYTSIPYQTDGSSYKNEISLRKALDQVGQLVASKHKTLVVEKLDTSASKRKSTYRDKKTNKIFHMFPYARYLEFVDYIGMKYDFEITKVNPSFTSVIGAIKYQEKMKLNSHIAASFVIARRGMGFSHYEKMPKKYKHLFVGDAVEHNYWKKFNCINKVLKEAKKIEKAAKAA